MQSAMLLSRAALSLLVCLSLVVAVVPSLAPGTQLYSFDEGFITPVSVALDAAGNVYSPDLSSDRIAVFGPQQKQRGLALPLRQFISGFNVPRDVALDADSSVYVADIYDFRIVVLSSLTSGRPSLSSSPSLPTAQ
jgi:hypothetical protein